MKSGGFASFLPFFGCYGPRDEISDEDEGDITSGEEDNAGGEDDP